MKKSSRISNAQTPMYEETNHALTLSNIQYSDITQLEDFISKLPQHPNVLSPSRVEAISKQRVCVYYKVSTRGMTLRNWVKQQQVHKKTHNNNNIRMTFTNVHTRFAHKITPYDIILPLIDGYEFMLNNNLLLNQSSINPDFIWVDYDEHQNGKLVIFAINTLETLAINYCGTIDSDKNYWSPELLGKYNHFKYYATEESESNQLFDSNHGHVVISQQKLGARSLQRYNTRPSTLSCVYSLGLVFYFIVAKHDPFPEQRIHVFDRPEIDVIKYSINPIFAKRIWTATEPQLNDRPTMNSWKESIQRDLDKTSKYSKCVLL